MLKEYVRVARWDKRLGPEFLNVHLLLKCWLVLCQFHFTLNVNPEVYLLSKYVRLSKHCFKHGFALTNPFFFFFSILEPHTSSFIAVLGVE